MRPDPGVMVVLTAIPRGMLDDLPEEDQQAIKEIVGKPVLLNEYDDAGRAELEFKDRNGDFHFIFVDPKYLERYLRAKSPAAYRTRSNVSDNGQTRT